MLGCSDKEACFVANISPATLYNYQNAHPAFVERKEVLKNNPFYIARRSVVNGMETNPELAIKYLERKKKDEFSLRSEITGKNGDPIEVKEIKEATDEDLYKLVNGNNTTTSAGGVSPEGAGTPTPA